MPLRAAASAVTWAAKGVDLREPLKPAPPADSHAITLPSRSLSETIVLLKEVLMCAWPWGRGRSSCEALRAPGRQGEGDAGSIVEPEDAGPAKVLRVIHGCAGP